MTFRKFLLATTILAAIPLAASPALAASKKASAKPVKTEVQLLREQIAALSARLNAVEAQGATVSQKADVAAAKANKAVTVNDKGAFVIPGTDTTIKLGGYAKLDLIHDFGSKPSTPSNADSFNFTALPIDSAGGANNRKNQTRLHARQSRINVATTTPSSYGLVSTLIEFDFMSGTPTGNGLLSNSYEPRLRHAYGTIGGWLAGQTNTLFQDMAIVPETLDANGPTGWTNVRQAQVRYMHDFKNGHTLAASVENPESDFTTSAGLTNTNSINQVPDMAAAYKYQSTWGHVGLRGVLRNVAVKVPSSLGGASDDVWGYGLALSGRFVPATYFTNGPFHAKDSVFGLFQGGEGMGRYLSDAVNLGTALNLVTGDLRTQATWGGYVGGQHFWTDTVRSSLVYGHTTIRPHTFLPGVTTTKELDSVHVNLIWSPVPSVDVGSEYIYGHREVNSGQDGYGHRMQASAVYRF
ncbi:MAG: porin [Alphaproteobacteria bacterium]|nr:MAG: porin [Alphaproteobacteria bacterium]